MSPPVEREASLGPSNRAAGLGRSGWGWVLAAVVLRVCVAIAASPQAGVPPVPRGAWPADHAAYVLWGREAIEHGVHQLYAIPRDTRVPTLTSDGLKSASAGGNAVPNYPPLSLYLVWAQALVLRAIDPALTANTVAARIVFSLLGILADLACAWGAWRLAGRVFGAKAGRVVGILCLMMPPMWLDSCWWGQTDAWMLAPAIWMMLALVQRRWLVAGVLWGVALALKPQAVLLAPVWAFAWLTERARGGDPGDDPAPRWGGARIVAGGAVALFILNLSAVGFWFDSGSSWFRESFLRNFTDEWPRTTMGAFNVWYLDLLLTYDTNIHTMVLGVSRQAWGSVLAACGLAVAWWAARRGFRDADRQLIAFAGLWLLAVVMLPTRVHERYIVLCLPFLIVAASGVPRARASVAALVIAASLQMTHHEWLRPGADAWSTRIEPRVRRDYAAFAARATPAERERLMPLERAMSMQRDAFIEAHRRSSGDEWALTGLSLASAAGVFVGLCFARRGPARDDEGTSTT